MRGLVALAAGIALAAPAATAVPPFGFGSFDPGEPLSITSETLEARERDGVRTLAFRRDVEVRQGALQLRAQQLEARYPRGSSEPEWLRARGEVRLREGERRAYCDTATYDRAVQRIVCRGNPAQLRDGENRLEGPEIVLDLAERRVRVEGGAEVEIHREGAVGAPEPAAGLGGLEDLEERGAPVRILAQRLEARDRDGERAIRFDEDVRVRQGALVLRADALEAFYPTEGRDPERLLAQGHVVVAEGPREARCERADYRPQERSVACEGDARLRDGPDRLSGDRIAFDFGAGRVEVRGDIRLRVESERRP